MNHGGRWGGGERGGGYSMNHGAAVRLGGFTLLQHMFSPRQVLSTEDPIARHKREQLFSSSTGEKLDEESGSRQAAHSVREGAAASSGEGDEDNNWTPWGGALGFGRFGKFDDSPIARKGS